MVMVTGLPGVPLLLPLPEQAPPVVTATSSPELALALTSKVAPWAAVAGAA
jgi:hypothetical protein